MRDEIKVFANQVGPRDQAKIKWHVMYGDEHTVSSGIEKMLFF